MERREAIKVIKKNWPDSSFTMLREALETVIPELKESEDERIRKALIRFHKSTIDVDGIKGDDIIAWLEKQGEQEPVDKVEPKFCEGDWTVSNLDGNVRQISEVHFDEYNSYYVVNGKSVNLEEYDRLHHLWTIQDAKDGDVLQLGEVTAIFQGYIGNRNCKCYCSVYDGEFEIPNQYDDNSYGCYNVSPATKEQRDHLFQKMREAGYEWDADKKELKKIHVIDEGKSEMDYCFTKMMNGEKINPAWSEDDEIAFNDALWCCKQAASIAKDENDMGNVWYAENWLKLLKERYTWKPSDEQMHYLYWIANIKLGDSAVEQEVSKHLNELYKDLKKLKG